MDADIRKIHGLIEGFFESDESKAEKLRPQELDKQKHEALIDWLNQPEHEPREHASDSPLQQIRDELREREEGTRELNRILRMDKKKLQQWLNEPEID